MNRDEFLANVRAAAGAVRDPYTRPIAPLERVPRVKFADFDDDPVAHFAERARKAGAVVHRTDDPRAVVRQLTAGGGLVATTREPEVEALGDLAPGRLVRWPDAGVQAVADAQVMVTGCAAAIAATGSVVMSSLVGRTAGLLTPRHIVVVSRDKVVRTPGEVLRGLPVGSLPSGVVFVTGPSRSADIEHKLAIGVHGPGELVIVLSA